MFHLCQGSFSTPVGNFFWYYPKVYCPLLFTGGVHGDLLLSIAWFYIRRPIYLKGPSSILHGSNIIMISGGVHDDAESYYYFYIAWFTEEGSRSYIGSCLSSSSASTNRWTRASKT